ncbi:hypothetical protein Bpla01_24700 [Burkholderia plantarii]|nr:hypothetical protein Bpla01_24700 [Burkholderia plantarii]
MGRHHPGKGGANVDRGDFASNAAWPDRPAGGGRGCPDVEPTGEPPMVSADVRDDHGQPHARAPVERARATAGAMMLRVRSQAIRCRLPTLGCLFNLHSPKACIPISWIH